MACGDFPKGGITFDCNPSPRNYFDETILRGTWGDVRIKPETKKPMKIKEIKIRQCDHGYILNVGCKEIALDTPAKIIFGLKLYLNNPEKVEKAFLDGKFKFEK
jgi:hypothetical protein